jgi:Holliday junction resolvase RusA-like endonuclease
MIDEAEFFVRGLPIPQGSKNAYVRGNRAVLVEVNHRKLHKWREAVAAEAAVVCDPGFPNDGPAAVYLDFRFPRPASHYGTGANAGKLKASAPAEKMTTPDIDKLARAVLDALTGTFFDDDKRVTMLHCRKTFSTHPGVNIIINRGSE